MMGSASSSYAVSPPSRRTLTREEYDRYMPVLRRMAMRFARNLPSSIAVSEIVGSGLVGLVNGLSDVDPEAAPQAAEDYLFYRIRGAMLDFVGSVDTRTQEVMAVSRRLARTIASLREPAAGPPTRTKSRASSA